FLQPFFSCSRPRRPRPTLFPYTTLFRSSLLKIMAGVDKEIEGEAMPMPGLSIGYLEQEPKLDPEHTVREAIDEAMKEVNDAKKRDRKSTRLNSSHVKISYAVFCLKKKNT